MLSLGVDHEVELENLEGRASYGELVGSSSAMRQVFGMLSRLESSLVNVLVERESGTGKELVARAIHEHSPAAAGPFVALNCGAMDRSLARSELFGHRRGAFTGASEAHAGAFEAASGGTLFLDEIGELPYDVQPLLLRALEAGAITRMGDTDQHLVKVRIVAATNRDLASEVRAGNFRDELYFRLAVVRIALPPLRDRPEDIALLAQRFAQEVGLSELGADVSRELGRRRWPGNARELRNAIHAYAVLGSVPEHRCEREGALDLAHAHQGQPVAGRENLRPAAQLREQARERSGSGRSSGYGSTKAVDAC